MDFLDSWADAVLGFIAAHKVWAGPIAAIMAFGESLAFLSLLIPGTVVIIGAGGLIAVGALDFWPIYLWAVPAAALGGQRLLLAGAAR